MFRNSDHDEEVPELESQQHIKTEPEVENEVVDGNERKPQFVQVKNRQVFDYEPKANSIHASMWPHWWLKAVKSKHRLRTKEAEKNVRFKTGLIHLLQEAIEVRTIKKFCFLIDKFKNRKRQFDYHESYANVLPLELL